MAAFHVTTYLDQRVVPTIIVVVRVLQEPVTEVRHNQDLAATVAISSVVARLQEQAALPMSIQ
jgi:hypothetical protein